MKIFSWLAFLIPKVERKKGLFQQWIDLTIQPPKFNKEIPGPYVIEVFQIWLLKFCKITLAKKKVVVARLSINQWFARVPFGDPLLTKEQFARFDRDTMKSITDHEDHEL